MYIRSFHIALLALLLSLPFLSVAQKQGQARIDSLVTKMPAMKEDSNKAKVMNELSNLMRDVDMKQALSYAQNALELAKKISWVKGVGSAYVTLGNVYHMSSDFANANTYYQNAIKTYESIDYKQGVAQALGNIGLIYTKQAKYPQALNYQFRALKINESLGNKKGIVMNTGNIGTIYVNQKNYDKALEYDFKALKLAEEINDGRSMGINLQNIGNTYYYAKKYDEALAYDLKAIDKYKELGNKRGEAITTGNIGTVYLDQKKFNDALKYFFASAQQYEALEDSDGISRNYGNAGNAYLKIYDSTAAFAATEYIPGTKAAILDKAILYLSKAVKVDKELDIQNDLQEYAFGLAEALARKGDYKGAFENYKLHTAAKDSIFSKENSALIEQMGTDRELAIRQKQIELDKLAVEKKKNERVFFIIGIVGLLLVVIFMGRALALLSRERKKSDQLLLNILPPAIAHRLKQKEHPIADNFQSASIIFIDIANFTSLTEHRPPKETVNMLNDIFTKFDQLADQFGLEKIKTIGDCYMAVCGLPSPRHDHVLATIMMAQAVKNLMYDYESGSGIKIKFRMGLDCGPVVAGVIGKKKFIYDLWGDAVNTASRMESTGLPGEIHCTTRFKEMANNEFSFESRGMIEVKGKGRMETWLIGPAQNN